MLILQLVRFQFMRLMVLAPAQSSGRTPSFTNIGVSCCKVPGYLASDAAILVYKRAFATQDGALATVAIFYYIS